MGESCDLSPTLSEAIENSSSPAIAFETVWSQWLPEASLLKKCTEQKVPTEFLSEIHTTKSLFILEEKAKGEKSEWAPFAHVSRSTN